jgi:hypothetical protein
MGRAVFIILLGGALVGGAFYVGKRWSHPAPVAPTPIAKPAAAEPGAPAPVETRAGKPAVAHPIPANDGVHHELPSLDQSDAYCGRVLRELIGRKDVASFLNLDGFARRFVATVNNLASDNASTALWPVRETPRRFETEARDDRRVISSRNAARYTPFVAFVEGVDSHKALAAYVAMYPLLQRAYEDLGEPTPYFNDRVVAVIDDLLATPDVGAPLPVKHIEADGASPSATAARLYVYDDASLERRTAGQKILLRVGHDHAKRLKAKLAEIRALLVSRPVR